MQKVETTLSRLDGVIRVKAGWRSDKASIVAEEGAAIDAETLNEALKSSGFKVLNLVRTK